ncbi:MAG: hypothetical protein R3F65_23670 [bacterium]
MAGLSPRLRRLLGDRLDRPGAITRAVETVRRLHWGRPAGAVVRVRRRGRGPAVLASLGKLHSIELADGRRLVARGPIYLACDPGSTDLYLVSAGGPVRGAFSGEVRAISYRTTKASQRARWRHQFAEPYPLLANGQITRGDSTYGIAREGIEG